jgi:hypothetical protein
MMESFIGPSASTDRTNLPSAAGNVKKVVIHIADGEEQSDDPHFDNFVDNKDSTAERKANYAELCRRIGANGVKLYFVQYGHTKNGLADSCIDSYPSMHKKLVNVSPDTISRELEGIVESNSIDDYQVKLID